MKCSRVGCNREGTCPLTTNMGNGRVGQGQTCERHRPGGFLACGCHLNSKGQWELCQFHNMQFAISNFLVQVGID